jgi:hypothetical protein
MSAYIWIVFIAGIMVFTLIFNMFDQTIYYSVLDNTRQYMGNNTSDSLANKVRYTLGIFQGVWMYWIIIILIGLIFWALTQAQRRTPYE